MRNQNGMIFRDSPPAGGQEAVQSMWFVYALSNQTKQKIYIGQTGNLEQRLAGHNKNAVSILPHSLTVSGLSYIRKK